MGWASGSNQGMRSRLVAAFVLGGVATIVVGAVLPPAVSVPVVAGCAVLVGVVLSNALARPFRQQLDRERQFSSNASHQLRTPLTALRLRLEDLTLWPQTDAEQRNEVEACIREVDRLSGTVGDLLALGRGEEDRDAAAVGVDDAVGRAAARWRPHFQAHGRSLLVRRLAEPAAAAIGPRSFSQVLDVLLENALRHGRGITDVTVSSDADSIVVSVSDQGALSDVEPDRLFERAYSGARSAGSGIGLWLAREIAAAAGGSVELRDTAPVRFDLRLPSAPRKGPTPA